MHTKDSGKVIKGGDFMIVLAVICTLAAGAVGAFLEPDSFSVSLPNVEMGGFILWQMRHGK